MILLEDMIEAGYTPDDWEWWDNLLPNKQGED